MSALILAAVLLASKADVEREISSAFERSEWTRNERIAFALSTAAHMLDLASSVLSDERCIERNPILGESPSNAALIAVKVAAIGFEYWLYSSPRLAHSNAHWYGYTSAIIHGHVAIGNFRNDCY